MEFQPFLDYIRQEKRYSVHTLLSYQKDLEQFQVFLRLQYEALPLADAGYLHIRSWIVHLMNEGIVPKSVNRKISTLRSFYKFMLRKGLVPADPTDGIQGPKTGKRNPVFVAESGMDQLLDRMQFPEGYEGARDRMILEMFYFTGMRLSELINLRLQDIDRGMQSVKVLGKRNKERLIPAGPVLLRSIDAYESARNDAFPGGAEAYFFLSVSGKKMYPKLVYNLVHAYLSAVTTIDKRSPHVLRHTFATHMLSHGADINAVKEILGHASLAATQVYTHNTLDKLKKAHKKAHPKA